jgi:hypothetical protein
MPIRRYRVLESDGREAEVLEVEQPMGSPDLERHPLDGRELRKLLETPSVGGKWSDGGMSQRLKEGGFRKLEKDGTGWTDVT